jgi:hypothetical protein
VAVIAPHMRWSLKHPVPFTLNSDSTTSYRPMKEPTCDIPIAQNCDRCA